MRYNVPEYERRGAFENEEILQNLTRITEIAQRSGIPNEQIVHVGGIAPMLHTCIATGQTRYAIKWRGTQDLDICLTVSNGPQRLADALGGSGIHVTNRRPSRSIAHKHAVEIELGTAKGLFRSGRSLEIDVYGGDAHGNARINDRVLHPYPGKFITERIITHPCWGHDLTIPNLLDTLILKMDVAKETDRSKDTIDISALLFSAEKTGLQPKELTVKLKSVYSTLGIAWPTWSRQVIPTLTRVCGEREKLVKLDFAPVASREYLEEVISLLR